MQNKFVWIFYHMFFSFFFFFSLWTDGVTVVPGFSFLNTVVLCTAFHLKACLGSQKREKMDFNNKAKKVINFYKFANTQDADNVFDELRSLLCS